MNIQNIKYIKEIHDKFRTIIQDFIDFLRSLDQYIQYNDFELHDLVYDEIEKWENFLKTI